MGEYRVKSGQSLPSLKSKGLPSLPKLGSLEKKKNAVQLNDDDFSFDNAETGIISTDDIMDAVGGIDGWDSVPDELGLNDDKNSLLDSLQFEGDEGLTSVFVHNPKKNDENLPSLKLSGNTSKSGNSKVSRGARGSDLDFPDLPSLKKVGDKGATGIAPASSGISPAPKSSPVVKSDSKPSIAPPPIPPLSENSETIALNVKNVIQVEEVSDDSETRILDAPTPAVLEEEPTPESAPTVPDSAHLPPLPMTTEKMPAVMREEEPAAELSDEEQFKAILAQMTPEERLEYEKHSADKDNEERKNAEAKQRELYEMYGTTTPKQSVPVGAIIIGLLVIAGFGAFIYWIINGDHSEPEKVTETVQQETTVEPERVYERAPEMDTYSVKLNLKGVSLLYINGVEQPLDAASYEFVSGHRNSIMAFGDGKTPYFRTFEAQKTVNETIDIALDSDSLWLKGNVKFRFTKPEDSQGAKFTFDGDSLGSIDSGVSGVVLGRPHVLIIEKPGAGKHMQLIWPEATDTTVTIPELVSEESAKAGTRCYVELPPASGKPVGIKIMTGTQEYNADAVVSIQRGAMIEYNIVREQRHALQVAIVPPDGFGTLGLDTTLLRDSIGSAFVSFNRAPGSELRVCLRRPGELICPDMKKETELPSGPDWEFFGIEGTEGNLRAIRGVQKQELSKNRRYGFDVRVDRGVFVLKQASYGRVKDN